MATRVLEEYKKGNGMVVVLSAMAGQTDSLIRLAREMCDDPDPRELDVLLATGEQVSVALLSMALHTLGVDAVSFLGHQVKIVTDSAFSKARIQKIETDELGRALREKKKILDDLVVRVMGSECRLETQIVDDIPKTHSGKYRYTVVQMGSQGG